MLVEKIKGPQAENPPPPRLQPGRTQNLLRLGPHLRACKRTDNIQTRMSAGCPLVPGTLPALCSVDTGSWPQAQRCTSCSGETGSCSSANNFPTWAGFDWGAVGGRGVEGATSPRHQLTQARHCPSCLSETSQNCVFITPPVLGTGPLKPLTLPRSVFCSTR